MFRIIPALEAASKSVAPLWIKISLLSGSNFILKDLTLSFIYSKPYDVIAKSQGVLDWRCIAAEVRTYFKGTLEVKM